MEVCGSLSDTMVSSIVILLFHILFSSHGLLNMGNVRTSEWTTYKVGEIIFWNFTMAYNNDKLSTVTMG